MPVINDLTAVLTVASTAMTIYITFVSSQMSAFVCPAR